eukprot:TRINITY_DN28261_c0_g1_i2.p1 TRINITY_DN28261_c0_g1~~TRINITY_DN28261_c0_g1_i2.p1  ORF type:complete len:112 (-),score=15.32 TRINITY_DN28261_c0_g1_i2:176-511(-)
MFLSEEEKVYLVLYDLALEEITGHVALHKLNTLAISLGFGAFHTGILVFGKEVNYGFSDGIHMIPPQSSTSGTFRQKIMLGTTNRTREDLVQILIRLGCVGRYIGPDYYQN